MSEMLALRSKFMSMASLPREYSISNHEYDALWRELIAVEKHHGDDFLLYRSQTEEDHLEFASRPASWLGLMFMGVAIYPRESD